ncbi:MAG: zinc ribbon domain-containing protein [Pirellulales bacterium]
MRYESSYADERPITRWARAIAAGATRTAAACWSWLVWIWPDVIEVLRVRADRCPDCGHEVHMGDRYCNFCGTRDPVQVPAWVVTIIAGFATVNVVSIAGRMFGA